MSAADREGRAPVGHLDVCAHRGERRSDPAHRPAREGGVADEGAVEGPAGQDAGQQPHRRARVAAVERPVGGPEPVEAAAPDEQARDAVGPEAVLAPLRLDAKGLEAGERRAGVGGVGEPDDLALALRQRGEEGGAVGDRLVGRERGRAGEGGGGVDGDAGHRQTASGREWGRGYSGAE